MLSKFQSTFSPITLTLLLLIAPFHSSAETLDASIDELVRQISQSMSAGKETKIAVIEFQDLFGANTEFEKFLTEELITKLFQTGKFRVIERNLLNKVLEEQKLSTKDIFDPTNIKKMGNLLVVDGIVTGTVADMETTLKVNARFISTETGNIVVTASTSITKDRAVMELRGEDIPLEMKKPGSILVKCEIDGTSVYLDNVYIGNTNNKGLLMVNVLPKEYKITLKKRYYGNKEEKITVWEGETAEVEVSLKKMGLLSAGELSFTSISAEGIPNEGYDWRTGEKTESISSAQLIQVQFPYLTFLRNHNLQGGIGYLWMKNLSGGPHFEVSALLHDLLSSGPFEIYSGAGLFGGFLNEMEWVKLSNNVPKDAESSDVWFWGWQIFLGSKIFFSANSALIVNVGYCNYSDLEWKLERKISEEESEELVGYPIEWQYSEVEIGGIAIKIGFMTQF